MRFALLILLQASLLPAVRAQDESSQPSGCFAFIDYQFIWTLEMVTSPGFDPVPVVNIITLIEGKWDLRPDHVHLVSPTGSEARNSKFSIDTGVPGEPYISQYLKVQGESFIGLDLIGEFGGFELLSEAFIDLDKFRFHLEPVDCLRFETLVLQIGNINLESPDLHQDYEVLNIPLLGRRETRRQYY